MTKTSEEFGNYLREIEKRFIRLRGTPFVLSPKDVHLILEWHREGIPLDIILGAVEETMERHRERSPGDKVSSLSYCRWSVARHYLEVKERLAGSSDYEPASFSSVIDKISIQWRESAETLGEDHPVSVCIFSFLSKIGRARDSGDESSFGKRLPAWRKTLFECILKSVDHETRHEIESAVDERLSGHQDELPPDAEKTLKSYLLREEVRQRFQLPPLFA